jgi:hypothetical protein
MSMPEKIPTVSQIISILIERLGGEPQIISPDDVVKYRTDIPTLFRWSDDGIVSVEVQSNARAH